MADMLPETEANSWITAAEALGELLREHKGSDVTVLDVRPMSDWTDFFVIATGSSNTHLDGLERHIKDYCRTQNMEILRKSRKIPAEDDGWRLIDLGRIIVHLMSKQARDFYELERLWATARTLRGEAAQHSHSSKS
jgi:ribosome-associated protein